MGTGKSGLFPSDEDKSSWMGQKLYVRSHGRLPIQQGSKVLGVQIVWKLWYKIVSFNLILLIK